MAEFCEPDVPAGSVSWRQRGAIGFVRFARDIVVVASTAFLLALMGLIGFTLYEMVVAPGRYDSAWSQGVVVDVNLRLHVVRALLFLGPLLIGGAIFATAVVLVLSGGRRALTAGRALDRGVVQFAGLVAGLAGIGVVVAAGASSQSGDGVLVSRAVVVLLGLLLLATGITVIVQRQWRSVRMAGAALAALAVLSVTASTADLASVPANTPLVGTGSTLAASGFWTADPRAKPGAVQSYTAASCPTPAYCIAWGQPLFGGSVWSVSTDGGTTWRDVNVQTVASPFAADPSPPYTSLSCWGRSSCLAGGGLATPVLTSDGGRYWSDVRGLPVEQLGNLTSQADCFAARRCLLVGLFRIGAHAATPTPILVTQSGGRRWEKAQLPPGQWSVATTSCPTASDCIALASTTGRVQEPAILLSTDGGLSWRRLARLNPELAVGFASSYLACTSTSACVMSALQAVKATRANPYPPDDIASYVTADGGHTWTPSKFPTLAHGQHLEYLGVPMVACSARLCVAFASPDLSLGPMYSPALLSADQGKQWTVDASGRSLAGLARGAEIRALTCDRGGMCLAVGQSHNSSGVIFYSHDGGVTWGIADDATGGPPWA
ncbi:MAG: hypothetical protein ABSE77_19305 [Acidimicrobiales bacterium]